MPRVESNPEEKIKQVEQQVKELQSEVERAKQSQESTPTDKVKNEVDDLTTEPTKSPRKILTLALIGSVMLLLISLVVFAITSNVLLWILIIFVAIVVLLSGRIE